MTHRPRIHDWTAAATPEGVIIITGFQENGVPAQIDDVRQIRGEYPFMPIARDGAGQETALETKAHDGVWIDTKRMVLILQALNEDAASGRLAEILTFKGMAVHLLHQARNF